MRAVVYKNYGSPDVLQLAEVDTPIPKDNEVLIRIYATTVNRTDCAMLRAKPLIMRFFTGLFKPKNLILGTDFAGKIEAIGKDVVAFKIGDRVFGLDDSGLSSHAHYMSLSQDSALTTIPKNITYEYAAASCEGAHYAYNFINKVTIKGGEKILVNGATGAIGSAAVQILKYLGVDVVAVCNTKNLELVKSLGADKVFDYTKEDFTEADQKYDYIFDAVGKSSFFKCKRLLRPGGAYISSESGYMAQNIFLALLTPLFGNKRVIFPIPVDTKGSVLFIKKLIEQGGFSAVIDRKYPLEQIADAYRYVEKGQKTGNVVIIIGSAVNT